MNRPNILFQTPVSLPRNIGSLWLLLMVVIVAGKTSAQDALTITTNHYLVSGTSLRELRRSIDHARPGGARDGSDGLTAWQIKWRTRINSANGECRLTSFEITTTVGISLPSWRAPTNAPPDLMKRWLAYYSALQRHEQYHSQSAQLAAKALRERVQALGVQLDCKTLEQRIKHTAEAVITEFRKRDEDYDRKTDHGRKEGASLP